jgi:hypothetical protein
METMGETHFWKTGALILEGEGTWAEQTIKARFTTPIGSAGPAGSADDDARSGQSIPEHATRKSPSAGLRFDALRGKIQVAGARFQKPVQLDLEGRMDVNPDTRQGKGRFTVRLDDSRLSLDWGLAWDPSRQATGAPERPPLRLDVRADLDKLDLDPYLTAAEQPAASGQPEAAKAENAKNESAQNAETSGVEVSGRIRIGALRLGALRMENLEGRLEMRDGKLEIRPLEKKTQPRKTARKPARARKRK